MKIISLAALATAILPLASAATTEKWIGSQDLNCAPYPDKTHEAVFITIRKGFGFDAECWLRGKEDNLWLLTQYGCYVLSKQSYRDPPGKSVLGWCDKPGGPDP